MKTSTLLKRAKTTLDARRFVCHAIHAASHGHLVAEPVLRRISASIAPYGSVHSWLVIKHEIQPNGEELRAYRHRWIDSLIAEYEKAGD